MFIPASRTCSSAARSSLARRAPGRRSRSGVQTAPRAKTRTPFTCRSSPSLGDVVPGAGPAASSRKPTRPASIPTSPLAARRRAGAPRAGPARRGCAATSGRVGNADLAATSTAPSSPGASPRARASASPAPRARPVGGARRRRRRARAASPRTASTPSSPSRRGRSASASTATAPRRSIQTGRQGPTAAGPGAKPGQRPSSIVRKKRRRLSASLVRQRARGLRRLPSSGPSARQRIASSFSAPRAALAPTSIAAAANIDSPARDALAVEEDLVDGGDAVERAGPAPRRRSAGVASKLGPKPPVLGVEVALVAEAPEAGVAQRARRRPGDARREPIERRRRRRPASRRRRARRPPTSQPSSRC